MRAVWMLGLLSGLGVLSWNAAPSFYDQSAERTVTLKHRVLTEAPKSGAVNRRVSDLEFTDLQGRAYTLSQLTQRAPVVFIFTATKCPAAQRYTVRINQLHETYRKKGVQVFVVYPNYDDTREAVVQHVREYGLKPPAVHDPDGALAHALGATMTPQAVLVDKKMLLRYRGAIDDNRYETRVRAHYLKDALDAVLAGKSVKVASAETFGCTIRFREEAAASAPITYAKHIAPILQEYCQPCHRPGEVAPFSLLTYRDAYTWRKEIAAVVKARQMPPWKPVHGYGEFQGERRLTDEQIAMILQWAETGAPMGDPNEMPPPRKFSNGWALGEPDIVFEMPVEYEIGPTGEDEYRHFVLPTNFDEDVFVRAIDIQPGNRNTVHHVIVYLDTTGTARQLDAADPKPGYEAFGWPGFVPAGMLGGWAPGMTPSVLPDGTGYRLPKGADVVLQIHYYRTGKPEKDRTRVGIYLEKKPNPQPVGIAWIINPIFRIPAGAERHEVRAMWIAPRDVEVVAITPHMHLLGREMRIEAQLPDGTNKTLIWINDWDFKWQDNYHYKTPVKLPRGTRVVVYAFYDNSEKNPNNPHKPPKDVTWGERTQDEMCLAFLHIVGEEGTGFRGGGRRNGGGGGFFRRSANP